MQALRIRGLLEPDAVGETTGLVADEVERLLADLVAAGDAVRRDGRVKGFSLTAQGRERHASSLIAERSRAEVTQLDSADAAFLAVNGRLKDVCTDWQLSKGEKDRGAVVGELRDIHEGALVAVRHATNGLHRFGLYAQRLTSAIERFAAGDDAALLRPMTGSYHDVWMELHQDLLLTLDRKRGEADGS